MPFQQIGTVRNAAPKARASISYMRTTHKNRPADKPKPLPRLIVTIPRAMLGAFKPKETALYEIHLGTGKDTGKARILPGAAGVAPSMCRYYIGFRFGFVPVLGDEIADRESVEGRPVDGGFEIDLPAWFKPNGA